ncbi:MAG: phytase [Bryobacterales bacterium]|nr:phytase [Bryobacterales bacterium]
MKYFPIWLIVLVLVSCGERSAGVVAPAVVTESVDGDPDDPAIWMNVRDGGQSRVVATVKRAAPDGSLVVFDLKGKIVQQVKGIDRPNNVDVEYGLMLGGKPVDIAVTTARNSGTMWVFAIDGTTGELRDVSRGGLDVFAGEVDGRKRPMGIGLYKRPKDGVVFAILSRKEGPGKGYLWQYRLEDAGDGNVRAVKVREFGDYSGRGEIEAVVVDDAQGMVFYSDEGAGIHRWAADPDDPRAGSELGLFGTQKYGGDREGLALAEGRVVSTDQMAGGSRFHVYRDGQLEGTVETDADSTDGVEASGAELGADFPKGMVVVMNSKGRNFWLYRMPEFLGAMRR